MQLGAFIAVSVALLLGLPQAVAQQAGGVGNITHLSGTITARRADGSTRFLAVKSQVQEGDTLSTAQGTYARLKLADGAEVVLRPQSQMKIDAFNFDANRPDADNMLFSLIKGGMRAVTGLLGKRNQDKVRFASPTATVGIRGTHFGMLLCQNDCGAIAGAGGRPPPNGLHVDVSDGSVALTNSAGQQVLNAGQFGYARDAATPPLAVPPRQGIQVTMPLAISRNAGSGATLGKTQDSECAVP